MFNKCVENTSSLMSLPCLKIKTYNKQHENSARDDSRYILKQEIRKTQVLNVPVSYFCSEVHVNIGNCILLEFSTWSYIKQHSSLEIYKRKHVSHTHNHPSLLSATNLWSLDVLYEQIFFFFLRNTANGPNSDSLTVAELRRNICMCLCCSAWDNNLTLYEDHSDW